MIDARIPLMAAQGSQVNLVDMYRQKQQMDMQRQQMEMQREQLDWQRELQGIKMDAEKAAQVREGLKDLSGAVRWADSPEKWAQVQQHYGQYDPQLASIPFEQREQALLKLGQMTKYLEETAPKFFNITDGGAVVATDAQGGNGRYVVTPYQMAPQAGGDMPTVSSPEEARNLPPGTQFRTPDGRVLRVPGGSGGNAGGTFQP